MHLARLLVIGTGAGIVGLGVIACAGAAARPIAQPEARATRTQDAVAILDGAAITSDDLAHALLESAGRTALREVVLDRLLERELTSQALTITPADIEAEREALRAAIVEQSSVEPTQADQLLARVRTSRGVGDARFEAQLRRSAALRRLVAGTIEITDEDINQAFAIRHGPRVACRLILVRTNAEAQQIREQLAAAPNLAALFPMLARTRSVDASAPRGGALDPISPADPTFPSTIRSALSTLEPGNISPVLAVDQGFAIVLVEDRVPGENGSLDTRREPLRRLLRLQRERVAMETKAEDLIRASRLTILDRRLDWSWRATNSSTSNP